MSMQHAARVSVRRYRYRSHSVVAAAFVLASAASSALTLGQVTSAWSAGVDGSWTDGGKWSTSPNFPNNNTPIGTTYTASLPIYATPYTVSLAQSISVST